MLLHPTDKLDHSRISWAASGCRSHQFDPTRNPRSEINQQTSEAHQRFAAWGTAQTAGFCSITQDSTDQRSHTNTTHQRSHTNTTHQRSHTNPTHQRSHTNTTHRQNHPRVVACACLRRIWSQESLFLQCVCVCLCADPLKTQTVFSYDMCFTCCTGRLGRDAMSRHAGSSHSNCPNQWLYSSIASI